MKHVTIVVPECIVNLNSIGGAYEILSRANGYWQKIGKQSKAPDPGGWLCSGTGFKRAVFQSVSR